MLKKIRLLLLPFIFFAQENTFYHYGIEEGLSQESVQCILKDSNGFVWVGTQEGLNRFDGRMFKTYKNDFESSNSLCGNDVEVLLEFENFIFIGTKNNGICYYDKSLNTFFKTSINEGICNSIVKYKNTIYVLIENKDIYKFESVNNSFEVALYKSFLNKSITNLNIDNSTLYVGTNTGEIYYSQLNSDIGFNKLNFHKKISSINNIFKNKEFLWIGTNSGLYQYDLIKKNLELITLKTNHVSLKNISVNKVVIDDLNFYIATDEGLFILSDFDDESKSFLKSKIFKGDKNNINSITSNRVYDVFLNNSTLWIGTNKLDVLSLKEPVFNSITTKSKPIISNNHIYSTYKTDKFLFVGTRNGLNCIDNYGKTTVISKNDFKLAGNVIRGITKDTENNLWLATTKGISIINLNDFNPKKPIITSIYSNSKPNSLSNNNARDIFIDNANRIWITTYGGGINLFTGNLNSNKISFKHFKKELAKNSLSSNFTFNINQTSDDSYWITTENGFNKLSFINNSLENYIFANFKKDNSNQNSIKSNTSLTTHVDRENSNILWIGTENGLHKFDVIRSKFTYYGIRNGLKNLVVYGIVEDEINDLWVSTNSGLFQFNKKAERFVNYTINDGLKNIEYNLGSEFYDEVTNQLYFGGTRGLDYFKIDNLDELYHEGNLSFTSLKIKEEEINPSEDHQILLSSIVDAKKIYLKHNDFPTKLKFANLDFNFPKSSNFIYKLLPNDSDWNPLNNQTEIQFLDLKSGSYELLIQGEGKGELWSKEPLRLQIIVSSPWYKSNLAYSLYALLFGVSILFLYRFQLKRSLELKESTRLKELNELKSKLYSNITHEFRTPLTVILGMTESITDNINASPKKTNSYLELIKRNSNNLLNLVNQILDLSKVEKGKIELNLVNDDIVKHIKYLTESFSSYAEEKNSSLIFYNEVNKLVMPFDRDKINKIISNLLSNSLKFSNKNSKIILYLKQVKQSLVIEVKDNGLGISKNNLPFIFDRFYQADNNKGITGTGIGLALTKELVELMNGTIHVVSEENIETVFTVNLPIQESGIISNVASEDNKIENDTLLDTDKPIALVIEDNNDVRTYIKLCLENDYLIIEAENGKQGIELALEHTPDIVISDVMMPLVDGFELCKTIKEDIKTNHIPIILLTAKNSQDSKIIGLTKGADAYLTKPFNKEELLIRIKKLIEVRELLQSKYKDLGSINLKEKATDKNDIFIQKAITLIHKNIENSEYHAKDLARELFLSESQLYRKLKAVTTYSTAIFIRKIKLQVAKKVLETTDKTIAEICYDTGFNNPSWFSKVFKQEFGFSPSNKKK